MASLERDSDTNEDFLRNWGVEKLKSYLSAREVPIGNTNKQGLLNLAIFARKLGLKVVKSVEKNKIQVNNERLSKLKLEEGRITLPDPDTMTDGWEDNALNYPELCQMDVEKYCDESNLMSHTLFGTARGRRSAMVKYNKAIGIKTGGREALRDGKSLQLSGHVKSPQYHGISGNIAYCFVRAKVGSFCIFLKCVCPE
ncbi:uncharacterized protein [Acropora muricata]|uniref:uncharacterized protein n=1 Tax=Acropora muricata TaxID=159855 RepID=UPI0034E60FDF